MNKQNKTKQTVVLVMLVNGSRNKDQGGVGGLFVTYYILLSSLILVFPGQLKEGVSSSHRYSLYVYFCHWDRASKRLSRI